MMKQLLGAFVAALLLITPALAQTTTKQDAAKQTAQKTQKQIAAEKKEAEQRAIEAHRKAFFERVEARKK